MKRDPHVLDLVLFLHPKKCLTCGREKFALLWVLETVPLTFFLVVFFTSNGIFSVYPRAHGCDAIWRTREEFCTVWNSAR